MGTRAVIARATGTDGDTGAFSGVYVHAGGAPTMAGRWLWAQTVSRFGKDGQAAAAHYIDQHPRGWAVLDESFGRNECFCHDRGEGLAPLPPVTQEHAAVYPFIYVLTPTALHIRHYARPGAVLVTYRQDRVDWEGIEERVYRL